MLNNRSTDGTEAAVQDWRRRHPDAPVRLLRNDENYGLGGSHKVAFGYAAAHGYQHLVVLHGDDQGAIADLLPIWKMAPIKSTIAAWAPGSSGQPYQGYSWVRMLGNHGFNVIFTLVAAASILPTWAAASTSMRWNLLKRSTTKNFRILCILTAV